jgi:hypothetical protein
MRHVVFLLAFLVAGDFSSCSCCIRRSRCYLSCSTMNMAVICLKTNYFHSLSIAATVCADIDIVKDVQPGSAGTYTVRVAYRSLSAQPGSLTNAHLVDSLPPSLDLVSGKLVTKLDVRKKNFPLHCCSGYTRTCIFAKYLQLLLPPPSPSFFPLCTIHNTPQVHPYLFFLTCWIEDHWHLDKPHLRRGALVYSSFHPRSAPGISSPFSYLTRHIFVCSSTVFIPWFIRPRSRSISGPPGYSTLKTARRKWLRAILFPSLSNSPFPRALCKSPFACYSLSCPIRAMSVKLRSRMA